MGLLLWACASMGHPEGGPRDETPPVFLSSTPVPGELNFKKERLVITFDENVQVEDAQNKVIVSPPQKMVPKISALGRRVVVTLRDTLLDSTTYTIDFSDAIKDLNEGNILDGFALDFSTGPEIDSLRISGMVFEAQTLEPAQGMLVGVHAEGDDSALISKPFDRVTRTNQLGQFTLRNLKPGSYSVYAVNDVNRDYKWDRSEDVAFLGVGVVPGSEQIMVTDTVKDSQGRDSVFQHPGTRFLPDDVLLTWFNEGYKPQYLSDYKRTERHKLTFNLNTRADSLPNLTLLSSPKAGERLRNVAVIESSPTFDTITYWLRDTAVINTDTLMVQARYFKTDSIGELALVSDTLKYFYKAPKAKKKDKEQADSVAVKIPALTMDFPTTQELNLGLEVKVSAPLMSLDSGVIKMDIKRDTLWRKVAPPKLVLADSLKPLLYNSGPYQWKAGETYRIRVDSAAVTDIYGGVNRPIEKEFTVKGLDDYSTVIFTVTPSLTAPVIVELLNTQDKPVKTAALKGGTATLDFVPPGAYYARLFIDTDSSGVWTTGSVADSLQPEEVYYFPKKLNLKKNWTVEQAWNIYELPLDQQKPEAIKKNKPKKKPGEQEQQNIESEDEEDDEFFDDPFMRAAMGKNRDNTDGINSNRRRY